MTVSRPDDSEPPIERAIRQAAVRLKKASGKNAYEVLGLGRYASPEEIRESFDRLRLVRPAEVSHKSNTGAPDPDALKLAYAILGNEDGREFYDGLLSQQMQPKKGLIHRARSAALSFPRLKSAPLHRAIATDISWQHNPGFDRYEAVWPDRSDQSQIKSLVKKMGCSPETISMIDRCYLERQLIAVRDSRMDNRVVAATSFELLQEGEIVNLHNFAIHPHYWGNHDLAFGTLRSTANMYTEWRKNCNTLLRDPETILFMPWAADNPDYLSYMKEFLFAAGARQGAFGPWVSFDDAKTVGIRSFRPSPHPFPSFQGQRLPPPNLRSLIRRPPGKNGTGRADPFER